MVVGLGTRRFWKDSKRIVRNRWCWENGAKLEDDGWGRLCVEGVSATQSSSWYDSVFVLVHFFFLALFFFSVRFDLLRPNPILFFFNNTNLQLTIEDGWGRAVPEPFLFFFLKQKPFLQTIIFFKIYYFYTLRCPITCLAVSTMCLDMLII